MLKLEVKIGRISAACPACGGVDFRAPGPGSMDVLACMSCGANAAYGLLQQQITNKTIAESEEAIKAARGLRERNAET
jgi:hypothetical protein